MSLKVLIVAATPAEATVVRNAAVTELAPGQYMSGDMILDVLVTGVGSMATAWAMKQWLEVNEKPGFAINIGIAGSYTPSIAIGDVVLAANDCFADSGIDDRGNFLSLFEAGLASPDYFPFRNGVIPADDSFLELFKDEIKQVRAITVNTATGSESIRNKIAGKFNPGIETMEGATFFYICSVERIPFMALRAVSNMVEPRDRTKWNIDIALSNLSVRLGEILAKLRER